MQARPAGKSANGLTKRRWNWQMTSSPEEGISKFKHL
jgi:hypothetical protein